MDDYLMVNVYISFHQKQMPDLIYGYVIVVSLCTLYKYRGYSVSFRAHEACAVRVQLETKLCPKVLYHFTIFEIVNEILISKDRRISAYPPR
jgi:hypothetical protein